MPFCCPDFFDPFLCCFPRLPPGIFKSYTHSLTQQQQQAHTILTNNSSSPHRASKRSQATLKQEENAVGRGDGDGVGSTRTRTGGRLLSPRATSLGGGGGGGSGGLMLVGALLADLAWLRDPQKKKPSWRPPTLGEISTKFPWKFLPPNHTMRNLLARAFPRNQRSKRGPQA